MPLSHELLHQLLRDASFARWARRTDPLAIAHWEDWLADHPEHQETAGTAARLLRGIDFVPRQAPESQIQQDWTRLRHRLPELKRTVSHPRRSRAWAVAAAIAVVLLSAGVGWIIAHRPAEVTYTTAYGEIFRVELPDGSCATLNANSELVYREANDPRPTREVQLTGEAFFNVVHQKATQPIPFIRRYRTVYRLARSAT